MKVTKFKTEYVIVDDLNKAILTVNEIKNTYHVHLRACKNSSFIDKVEEFAKTLIKKKMDKSIEQKAIKIVIYLAVFLLIISIFN